MTEFSDELENENRAATQASQHEPAARVEFDGSQGFIQTGAEGDGFNPDDFKAVLKKYGRDPDNERIVGRRRESHWQRWDGQWLTSYRYSLEAIGLVVDLPALYADVAKTRARPLKPKTSEATVVVCWADIQVGKVDHLGGLEELLSRLYEKRAKLDAYLKRAKFDHIVIADCGDIIEGFDNFPAQTRTNALSLMDQLDVAATEFWRTIKLCERHAPVDVLSIPSNHCAWRRQGKQLAGKPTDDWGLYISRQLEKHNDPDMDGPGLRLTFHRPPEWQETLQFDIRATRLALAHGHQVNNPDQIKTWWAKMTHSGVLDAHILLTGHFHFASLRPVGKEAGTNRSRWHIQAPTLDNGSSWVRNKYGEDGDPALLVFQVDGDGFDVTSFALL